MFRKLLRFRPGLWVTVCMAVAAMLMSMFLLQFMQNVERYQVMMNDKHLTEMARRNANAVRSVIGTYYDTMRAVAILYETFDNFTSPQALAFLDKVAKNGGNGQFSVAYSNGISFLPDGRIKRDENYEYKEKILNGESFVSDVVLSESGTHAINLYVPLYKNGAVVAALKFEIENEKLIETFGSSIIENFGYFHIIDQKGSYIAVMRSEKSILMNKGFFTVIENLVFEDGYSGEKLKSDFIEGRSGFTKYSYLNEARHAYYEPVNINGWMMMAIIPKNIITQQIDDNVNMALNLLVKITLLLAVLFGWLIYTQRNARIRATLNERCYKLLAEQTGKVIYEWDFEGDRITTLSNFESVFGQMPSRHHSEKDVMGTNLVHPEDLDIYKNIYFEIHSGRNVNNVKFRLKDSHGDYQWCTFTGIIIRNDKGNPFKALGTLESIDRQVRVEEFLRLKANTDSLTGLYNKKTSELLISEALITTASKTVNALICADVDNFKNINDSFGHLYGDGVLKDITQELKKTFRSSDILGRFGGDEFVIFLFDIPSVAFVEKKAAELCHCLEKEYSEGGVTHRISISLGIAIYPDNGVTYEELYNKADYASYEAKRAGKNTFRFATNTKRGGDSDEK